ncbi:MAG: DNA polymerase III subunit delta [Nitrospirae bacterium]|nr:DNA polymerase III subunit delta [Nitrospirota bacterium]
MSNSSLEKELEKGLPRNLYYFWGEEAFFLDEALRKAVGKVISGTQADFNYDTFYPSSSPGEILDAASTLPFMAARRLVVLKDFHQYSKSVVEALMPCLREPFEHLCMLVFSQKAPPKKLAGVQWMIFKAGIQESEVPGWLKRFAAERGLQLSAEAVDSLIEHAGFDAGLLASEVEKLLLSGKKRIDEKDVTDSTSSVREYTTFNLIDAIVAGQRAKSFTILRSLLSEKALATVILGTLNWHYREFYDLWLNKGRRPAKMRDSTYGRLSKNLRSFNEDDFQRIFQSLHEADAAVKSGRPELVLEVLLIKLLQQRRAS